jgi:hypothetical protein
MSPIAPNSIVRRYFEVAVYREAEHAPDDRTPRPAVRTRRRAPKRPRWQLDFLRPWDSWTDDCPEGA